jgi:uncharacterized protein (TIGR03083 family)
MTSLPHDRFCDEIVNQTGLLREVVAGADLSATVPTAPDWTLADLLRHIGGNLRALEQAVRTGVPVIEPGREVPGHAGPGGDDPAALDAWLSSAAGAAAATLRSAGPDVEAQMWNIRWPTAAWTRRAAQDITVHRADAAGTVGAGYTVDGDLAVDAVDEFLDLLSGLAAAEAAGAAGDGDGASGDRAEAAGAAGQGAAGTVHLHATDAGPGLPAEWLVTLDLPAFRWRHAHEKATVAVRAPLADLLRVVTRRLPPDAEGVEVLGDRAVLDAWLERLRLQ